MKKWVVIVPAVMLGAIVMAFCILWYWEGPWDLSQYPLASESPYRLPWPSGISYWCVQGNNGIVSHHGWQAFSYDFAMPVGSDVCAARAGEVVSVVVDHDGHGYKWPNNFVVVKHEDGTFGNYLHLKKGGSRVKVGDHVEQGQPIAYSGHVGNSMMPHLHFHVTNPERNMTLPVTFTDVVKDAGIPRDFKKYTSGNVGKGAMEIGPR